MPAFLEEKLKREYPGNNRAVFGTMNKIGAMHGNKETDKGRQMEAKHAAKLAGVAPMRFGGVRFPWEQPDDMAEEDPDLAPPLRTPAPMSQFDVQEDQAPSPFPAAPPKQMMLAANEPPPSFAPSAPSEAPTPILPATPEAPPSDVQADQAPDSFGNGAMPPSPSGYSVQPEQQASTPTSKEPLRNQGKATDYALQRALQVSQEKPKLWQNILGAALQAFPRTRGAHIDLHPNITAHRAELPLLFERAKEERLEQQAQGQEETRKEGIEASREWRMASAAARLATVKPAVTPLDRYKQAKEIPGLSDDQIVEFAMNGKVKESPERFGTVPAGGSVYSHQTGKITGSASNKPLVTRPGDVLRDPNDPSKILATNDPKETPDKETINQWIADSLNSDAAISGPAKQKIAAWERTQKNQRPPVTINWTPQQATAATTPLAPGQRNEEFLKTLNPQDQMLVKRIVDYDYPLPTGSRGALTNPTTKALISNAMAYDPAFTTSDYQVRQRLRQDFTSGKSSQNIRSLNTLTGHLGTLDEMATALANKDTQLYNRLANELITAFGDPRLTNFDLARAAVAGELSTAFKGQATDTEIKTWAGAINSAGSPEQLRGAVTTPVQLMHSRLAAFQNQYSSAMGKPFKLLSPEARATMQKFGFNPDTLEGAVRSGTGVGAPKTAADYLKSIGH